ncbi:MAG: preprotein translocase subunit SecY [Candidatus Hecatellales archaeon]|nr:MAG: preprotein translocase subunit SecY [Candidatus Hecatellales archaeon]
MAGIGITTLAKAARFIPEAEKPARRVSFTEKLFWTGLVVVVYLVMTEIPLYGIPQGVADPFAMMRIIFASRRGSLMELGIGPIVTAGLILQLLVGSKMVELDFSKPEDRAVFTAANKVLALIITLFEGSVFVFGGVYGRLPLDTAILVLLQLFFAGMMVILLDELVQKGWGLGSGISLFIAAGVAQHIFWGCLSPLPAFDGFFLGALLAFGQAVASGNIAAAIVRSGGLPDMVGFISMIILFIVIVYLEGLRVEIPLAHARFRGFRASYPVKFFYVSNIPVILASALFANVYFFAHVAASRFPGSLLASILGSFDAHGKPIGGLVYFLTPPRNIILALEDPLRVIVYTVALILVCIVFSVTWVEVGGLSPRNVAKQLIDSGMQVPGFRRAEKPIADLLNRYIPALTIIGGMTVGLIAAVADFFNTIGTGIGILLTTGIMWQYYQIIVRERVEEMYPGLARLLGRA